MKLKKTVLKKLKNRKTQIAFTLMDEKNTILKINHGCYRSFTISENEETEFCNLETAYWKDEKENNFIFPINDQMLIWWKYVEEKKEQ